MPAASTTAGVRQVRYSRLASCRLCRFPIRGRRHLDAAVARRSTNKLSPATRQTRASLPNVPNWAVCRQAAFARHIARSRHSLIKRPLRPRLGQYPRHPSRVPRRRLCAVPCRRTWVRGRHPSSCRSNTHHRDRSTGRAGDSTSLLGICQAPSSFLRQKGPPR